MRIGIIGGTGVHPGERFHPRKQITGFGEATVLVGALNRADVVFVQRHGPRHSVPPHRINYRANVAALRDLGVERCFTVHAVGGIRADLKVGDIVALSGFVDFSRAQVWTFYDGGVEGVVHTDFSEPYCPELRSLLERDAAGTAVYVGVDGPRYETPSEIEMFRMIGGGVVGMTAAPEAILTREAGICCASLAVVTNIAAAVGQASITHQDVLDVMENAGPRLWELLSRAISAVKPVRACNCKKNWELWTKFVPSP